MKIALLLFRWTAGMASTLILVCGLLGCLSKPALTKQTYIFDAVTVPSITNTAGDRVLSIRKLQIATPFEGRSLVYRTGESAYDRDPYAEFLDWPADQMISSIRRGLRESGIFRSITESGSALKPDTLVEITVSQLYGDFRQPENPVAVLSMRFVFFDAPKGVPDKTLLQKEYSRRLPLKKASADALINGWNRALSEILVEVATDVHRSVSIPTVR